MEIKDFFREERQSLEPILEESFSGWYLQHAKRTLRNIEIVRATVLGENPVGLVMLSWLRDKVGYVYYVAVLPEFRGQGIAGHLLDHSLDFFFHEAAGEVYASVTGGHDEPIALFTSRGFRATGFRELSRKYGLTGAMNLYWKMLVVSGESLLVRER